MTITRSRSILSNERGVALIEFALSLPFLILLYVGGYQLTDALTAYRKVTITTRSVADLASQYTSIYDTDLDKVLNASQQIMSPYSIANVKLTVSQINVDGSGTARVDWSRGKNTEALNEGDTFDIPASIRQNNSSLIISDVTYNYIPVIASDMIGPITFRDRIIMSPRATDSIAYHES
jgi:Flp pilus assembly protein TadG